MSESESPIVSVSEGQLLGRLAASPAGKPYYCFQGIPYAKPPLGSLRFQDPQPVEPWEDLRDATKEGSVCSQIDIFVNKPYEGTEDCLYLNVYTPKLEEEALAVMVYIHGGGFRCGSGNSDQYGPDFLVEQGVVVVTLNYRVGPLGFLCLNTPEVPGNAGLKDIVFALRWVKKNISNFGGNPDNITIFGESAGGAICSLFTASPLTKDLISKAIVQSGTCLSSWVWQRRPIENAEALAKELGCESEDIDGILDFLREIPAQTLIEAYEKLNPSFSEIKKKPYLTAPVIEKEFQNVEAVITQPFIELLNAGKVVDIPIMIGTTDYELIFPPSNDDLKGFIPEEFNIDADSSEADSIVDQISKFYFKGQPIAVENWYSFFDLLSDFFIKVATNRYVKYLSNVSKQPIYVYAFDYFGTWNLGSRIPANASLDIKRAVHTDELWYLFRNAFNEGVEGTNEDKKIRERMVRLWTNFAKNGDPTPSENHYLNVTWAPITKDHFYYLRITNELSLHTDPEKERMEFWEDLYSKYFKIWEQPKSNEDEIPIDSRAFKTLLEETIATAETNEDDATAEAETNENEATAKTNEDVAPATAETNDDAAPETNEDAEVTENTEETQENVDIEAETAIEEIEPAKEDTAEVEAEIAVEDQDTVVEEEKEIVKSSDPPEDDLPKNIGVDKFVSYYDSLGDQK